MIALIRNAPKQGNLFMVRFCDDSKEVMDHLQSRDWLVQDAEQFMEDFAEVTVQNTNSETVIEWARCCIDTGLAIKV